MRKAYTFILAIALLSLSIFTPTSTVSAYDTSHSMSDVTTGPAVFHTGQITAFGSSSKLHKFTTHRSGTALITVVNTNYGGPLQIQLLDAHYNVIPNHNSGITVQANQTYYLKVSLTGPNHPNGASYVYMGHYVV